MTETQYTDYFRALAIKYKAIRHNDGTNIRFIDDADTFDSKNMKPDQMYCFSIPPGTRFTGPNNDALVQRKFGELWFLISCQKNSARQREARETCCTAAEQFLAQLKTDRETTMHPIIKDLDIPATKIDAAGPLFTAANAHGVVMQLFIGDRAKLIINSDLWD